MVISVRGHMLTSTSEAPGQLIYYNRLTSESITIDKLSGYIRLF